MDAPSIGMIPSGYKDGKLYSVYPLEGLGEELITNGDFSQGSQDWTIGSGWSIGDGKLVSVNGANYVTRPNATIVSGKTYKISYEVKDYVSGTFGIRAYTVGGITATANGTYTDYITSNGSTIELMGFGTFNGSVTNISVKEDTSADFDFTRGSLATRVNAQGLVEDVNIISEELTQNGNFDEIGSEEVSNGDFSQIGNEEVSNGDFSQEGSELVTGDNSSFDSSTGNWQQFRGVMSWDSSIQAGKWTDNGNTGSPKGFTMSGGVIPTSSGKIYRVKFIAKTDSSSSFNFDWIGESTTFNTISNPNLTSDFQDYEFTFTASGNNQRLYIALNNSTIGNGESYWIDNVSCVEVGQDWSFGTGWGMGDGKAVKESGVSSYLLQTMILPTPNTYKVTFTVSDYVSGDVKWGFTSTTASVFGTPRTSDGTYTEYFSHDSDTIALRFRASSDFEGSIDDITIKQVGQDWVFSTNWIIEDGKAVCDGTNSPLDQYSVTTVGKTYKVQLTVSDMTTSSVNVRLGTSSSDTIGSITDNGTYTFYGTVASNTTLRVRSSGGFDGSVTNISVKEVLQDWEVKDYGAVSASAVITPEDGGVKLEKTSNDDWRSSFLVQSMSYTVGSKYKATFSLKNGNISGTPNLYLRSGYDISSQNRANIRTLTNDWVEHTYYFEADSNSDDISIGNANWQNAGAGEYFYIDNFSVKEITDATDLPRLNYDDITWQDTLSDELITNGGFDTDSNWNKGTGWSISDGKAVVTSGSDGSTLSQDVSVVGKTNKVTFTISDYTGSGFVRLRTGDASQVQDFNANGTYTIYVEPTTATFSFARYMNGTLSIDNVSVKEVTGQEVASSGCPILLLEPQSTNLITYSEDYSQNYWLKTNATVSVSTITDPSGNQNSFKLVPDSGTGGNRSLSRNFTSLSGLYTNSVFAKKGEYNYIALRTRNAPNISVMFDLENGTFNVNATAAAFDSAKIENYGNGWYKCSVTLDSSQMTNVGQIYTSFSVGITGSETNAFNGDGISGVYIWGAQFEEGYASSYIPTNGSIQTRLKDEASRSGLQDHINSTEGVLYAEIAALATGSNHRYISLSDGTSDNRFIIRYVSGGNNQLGVFCRVGGVTQFNSFNVMTDITDYSKIALKYGLNNYALWIDGFEIASETTANVPTANTLDRLRFEDSTGGANFYGKNKDLRVYKTALSDEDLQKLTS